MSPDPRPLADWLGESGTLRQVLKRTERLVHINRELRDWLQEPWAASVRLARLEGATALFYTNDASISTLLRFRATDVVAWLRERHAPSVTDLQIKVRPMT